MQSRPVRPPDPPQRGAEAWLPPLLLAVTNLVVAVALIAFLFVAGSMRGRIPLPPAVIPSAMVAVFALCLLILWRAVRQILAARRAWRGDEPPQPSP